ncbi:ATP-binding protein (plasmid) [Brucella anthropi]|nr:ATP-binding protein [Brucella anthropi]QQC26868.1 ATP-binding protein [Brucella anthropi]SUB55920.1 cytochrome c biogenesis protein CcmA [Brucella anthropi]
MPKIQSLKYYDRTGDQRIIGFNAGQLSSSFELTLLTGQNGSQKSSVLRDLVSALILPDHRTRVQFCGQYQAATPTPVICFSGSVADRFPVKMQGGRRTEYDVANYHYIGQRAGTNLLSKKLPLETAVIFALNPAMKERFRFPFFERAFSFSGLLPRLSLDIRYDPKFRKRFPSKTPHEILAIALDENAETKNRGGISKATAQSVVAQFSGDDFNFLNALITERKGKFLQTTLDQFSVTDTPENRAVRLGLLLDILIIDRAFVQRPGEEPFSAYELSSGEYHMLTSLLALGFSVTTESIVLIDEPENSLHPQWQQDFMSTVLELCELMQDGHLVISTHSPLIVASAKPDSMIVDLSIPMDVMPAAPIQFGASSDSILFDQFGIASSRNLNVVDLVQKAVNLVEHDLINSTDFIVLLPKLRLLREALSDTDPLIPVIDVLLEGALRD